MTVTLYGFGESGNAYKVALMLQATATPWDVHFVDFFKGEARSPEFMRLNEMGEVPVLVDGDQVLTQSGLILDHLVQKTGQFGGTTAAEAREIWRWILWDNHKLSTQIGTARFLANFLPEEKRPAGVVPFLQGRLKAAYTVLNRHLEARDWMVRPSQIFRVVLTFTTRNPLAFPALTGPPWISGWTASQPCPAGRILMIFCRALS